MTKEIKVTNDPIVQYAGGIMVNHAEDNLDSAQNSEEVKRAPSFVSFPSETLVAIGGALSLSAEVSGDDLEYQWQRSDLADAGYDDVDGATDATYTKDSVSAEDSGFYRLLVKNKEGGNISSPVHVIASEVEDDDKKDEAPKSEVTDAPKADEGEELVEEKK